MTTQNTEVNTETKVPETNQETETAAPVVNPVEQAAREAGWVSKDEWVARGKNPDDWRSAKEFQERGELFDEIHRLQEDTKKTKAAFKVLVEHHKKVRETAVKEAIAQLKAEKRVALENHEIERVFEIDEQIEKVKDNPDLVPNIDLPEEPVGPTPTFKRWHKRNSWYELSGDDEASRFADTLGAQFKSKNPNATEEELLEHVESKIARRFPELFENQSGSRVSEVNPRSNGKAGPTSDSFKLTEDEERACKMFVDQGIMTRKQYIDELKKTRT